MYVVSASILDLIYTSTTSLSNSLGEASNALTKSTLSLLMESRKSQMPVTITTVTKSIIMLTLFMIYNISVNTYGFIILHHYCLRLSLVDFMSCIMYQSIYLFIYI